VTGQEEVQMIQMQFDELVTERPFTHPDHISKDREIMTYMAVRVCAVLETHFNVLQDGQSIIINESDGRGHRFFVPRPTDLSHAKRVFVVGFFGQRRKGMSTDHFGDLDDLLVEILPTLEEILSYSTLELPGGDFGNLVLLLFEEIKSKWMEGDAHRKAVDLSPGYYRSIRINNGVFPEGILFTNLLQITRVKYYDYQQDPPWKAVRELSY
jgi:hypothetical protein